MGQRVDNTQSTKSCWHLVASRGMRLCDPEGKNIVCMGCGCSASTGLGTLWDSRPDRFNWRFPWICFITSFEFFFFLVYACMNPQICLHCPLCTLSIHTNTHNALIYYYSVLLTGAAFLLPINCIKFAYNVTQEVRGKTECSSRHSDANNFLYVSSRLRAQAKHRFPSLLFKNYF